MVSARQLSSLALFAGALGGRIKRTRREAKSFIAGVPVLNYHLAYAEHANLAEMADEERAALEQDWLVVVTPETSDEEIQRLCKMTACVTKGHPGKGGVPYFEVRSTEDVLSEVIEEAKGSIQFVEPDSEAQIIPDIENDNVKVKSWGLGRIAAPARSSRGSGVHVYVLDTGIRASHDDFGGRVTPTLDLSVKSTDEEVVVVECSSYNGPCAGDVQGHGTHCAGTAAGTEYGVAPLADLHSIKVLSDSGSGAWGWSYASLDWLATKGLRPAVASMSLGGSGTLQAMATAVTAAVDSGVTVVVAGGNDNSDACRFSPAFVPAAITVGSTTSLDVRSSFSNYGSCTNIWAPGSDIVSASSSSDDGNRTLSGTSMACPHVSGAAALQLEMSPSMKSPQVLNELLKNAAIDALAGLRSGDTNALLYVGAGGAPPTPPTPAPVGCPSSISSGPDNDGDCKCYSGTSCYEDGEYRCTYSYTERFGSKSTTYFLPGINVECK